MREEIEKVTVEREMTLVQRVDALEKKFARMGEQHAKADDNAESHHMRLNRLEKETGLSREPREHD